MLTDNDKMPFGKFEGKKLSDVPDEYFLFCFENGFFDSRAALKLYVIDNLAAIKKNISTKIANKKYGDK